MPNYEYACQSCGHQLEAFQKITENPLAKCPQCKKDALKRGIGGGSATFRFRGSGFYINDSKETTSCPKDPSSCECSASPPKSGNKDN